MAARVLVVQNDAEGPIGPLGDWLTAAGVELDVVPVYDGTPLPEDLSNHDGLLVLGGGMGAADDDVAAWLPHVRALLRAAVAIELPTLGICLGGQLLALANGGRVERNPGGPEFGAQLIAKRGTSANDPLFGPLPITPDVIQWHFDAITVLPPGAVPLAASPGAEIQAFRLGRLAWGTQFHIETTPELVRVWAAADAEALQGYDVPRLLSRSDAAHADVAEVWAPFAASFAEVVQNPESVASARAVPTSTAQPITDPAQIRAALAAEATAAHGPVALPTPAVGQRQRQPGHD
jgi:GMP synthase (glutamine-hydrolysing)